jgi:hypothetical protein
MIQAGCRDLDRIAGRQDEEDEEGQNEQVDAMDEDEPEVNQGAALYDDEAIAKAIDEWDDSLVDPSLEAALGDSKPEAEKTLDDKLQEVTDLIETLASHQRIRNLVLPSSQTRADGAPVNHDMLAHGSVPQPSDEEMAAYTALKSRLASIIATLPPYVVSKLGGEQIGELLVSTKLQVATEEFEGTMQPAPQHQMPPHAMHHPQAASTPVAPRTAQRAPSTSSAANPQFSQFASQQSRTPVQPPQFNGYRQQQQAPQTVPRHGPINQRPPSTTTNYRQQQPQPQPQPQQQQQPNGYSGHVSGGVHPGYPQQMGRNQPPPPHARQPGTPLAAYPPGHGPPQHRQSYSSMPPQTPTPGVRGYTQAHMQVAHQQPQQFVQQQFVHQPQFQPAQPSPGHPGYAQGNHPGQPIHQAPPGTPGIGGPPPQHPGQHPHPQAQPGFPHGQPQPQPGFPQYANGQPQMTPGPNRTASPQVPQVAQMRGGVPMQGHPPQQQPYSQSPMQTQQRFAPHPQQQQQRPAMYSQQQQQHAQHAQQPHPIQQHQQRPMSPALQQQSQMQQQARANQGPPFNNTGAGGGNADMVEKARMVAQNQQQIVNQQQQHRGSFDMAGHALVQVQGQNQHPHQVMVKTQQGSPSPIINGAQPSQQNSPRIPRQVTPVPIPQIPQSSMPRKV